MFANGCILGPHVSPDANEINQLEMIISIGMITAGDKANLFDDQEVKTTGDIRALMTNFTLPIKSEYNDGAPIPGKHAYIVAWKRVFKTEAERKEKVLRPGKPTIITAGTNINRSNRTNVWTQALKSANSLMTKRVGKPGLILAMLAKGEGSGNPNPLEILADLGITDLGNGYWVSTKIDGNHAIASLRPSAVNPDELEAFVYSGRGGEPIAVSTQQLESLRIALMYIYETLCVSREGSMPYLDGELFVDGGSNVVSLQHISGICNRKDANDPEKLRLTFMAFDLFIAYDRPIPFDTNARMKMLNNLAIKFPNLPQVHWLLSKKAASLEQIADMFRSAIEKNHEGLILRPANSYYKPKVREMIKMKPKIRNEVEVIGFTDGKGKHVGHLVLKCRTTDKFVSDAKEWLERRGITPKANGGEFDVTPKLSEDVRASLFVEYHRIRDEDNTKFFDREIKGKIYTIEFATYSDACKPTQPVGIQFFN